MIKSLSGNNLATCTDPRYMRLSEKSPANRLSVSECHFKFSRVSSFETDDKIAGQQQKMTKYVMGMYQYCQRMKISVSSAALFSKQYGLDSGCLTKRSCVHPLKGSSLKATTCAYINNECVPEKNSIYCLNLCTPSAARSIQLSPDFHRFFLSRCCLFYCCPFSLLLQ